MDDTIYLEVDEEITSVIDRMRESGAKKISIVVPRGAMVLQSVVNLKLIKREAEKEKKAVAVITVDKVGRSLAKQVGLPVFDDPKQATSIKPTDGRDATPVAADVIEIDMSEEGPSDELPEGVNVNYYTGEKVAGRKEEKPEKSKPERAAAAGFASQKVGSKNKPIAPASSTMAKSKPSRPRRLGLKIGIAIAVVVIALVGMWLAFTRATVQLTVSAEEYEAVAKATVDATLMKTDIDEGKIKGTLVSTEKEITKDVNSTGIKEVGEKSSGTITFNNDSGVAQKIESGTSLTSDDGKQFKLTQTISVPKASLNASGKKVQGSTEGSVESTEAGSDYNMSSATTYVVSGNNYVTAVGETSGGTTEEIKIVSQEDIDNAENALVAQAPEEMRDDLRNEASGEYVIESAIAYEVEDFSTSKNVDEEAESFTVSANIVAQVVTFKEDDLRQVIAAAVESDLPEGKSLLIDDEDVITPELESSDIDKKELVINGKLASHIGEAPGLDAMASEVKGKSVKNARQVVADATGVQIDDILITIRPNIGLLRMPFFTKNIDFEFEYDANKKQEDSSS